MQVQGLPITGQVLTKAVITGLAHQATDLTTDLHLHQLSVPILVVEGIQEEAVCPLVVEAGCLQDLQAVAVVQEAELQEVLAVVAAEVTKS